MLNHDERRPDFDAFYRSLDDTERAVFMADAQAQWEGLQDDEPGRVVSLIDCMENVWDLWRELGTADLDSRGFGDDEIVIARTMRSVDRLFLEAEYRRLAKA